MVTSRGHLNPGDAEIRFDRFDPALHPLVRHVWLARWDVPEGQSRPQRVLTYPAGNVVVGPDEASLHGTNPRVQVRELTGRSWVVGILLRPAAIRMLTATPPVSLVASSEPLPSAPSEEMVAAMSADDPRATITTILQRWLRPLARRVDDAGLLANEACRIAEEDAELLRVVDLAARLGVGERHLRRIVHDHVGLTPKWLIECRRLQAAATTLFGTPATDLAALAADLGYADQAHFTRSYRAVLGETPDQTRRAGAKAA
ncbi:AraC family transcriptional regulator [Aeromicrobium phragmitis]|uniref:AraC family transcriptional regulator n=1 Tax=Aeromicrobium phragmitis TaxID=2478914 RepID=A0A3L8PK13_9ACTN|nr:helix-turn-helix domain-containing protein [Aeromicrobium phragmitis]RLV55705.1 AraC family transcriptional regulator [Aeromicrobium phragmitis]